MEVPGRQLRLGILFGVLAGAAFTLVLQTLNGMPKQF